MSAFVLSELFGKNVQFKKTLEEKGFAVERRGYFWNEAPHALHNKDAAYVRFAFDDLAKLKNCPPATGVAGPSPGGTRADVNSALAPKRTHNDWISASVAPVSTAMNVRSSTRQARRKGNSSGRLPVPHTTKSPLRSGRRLS